MAVIAYAGAPVRFREGYGLVATLRKEGDT